MPVVAAGIDVVIIALAAMLLLMAYQLMVRGTLVIPLRQLGQAEHSILDSIPFIGGLVGSAIGAMANGLANGVESVMGRVENAVTSWVEGAVGEVVNLIYVSAATASQLSDAAAGLAEDVAGMAEHFATVTIPRAVDSVRSELVNLIYAQEHQAEAFAQSLAQGVEARAIAAEQSIEAEIQGIAQGFTRDLATVATVAAEDVIDTANAVRAEVSALGQGLSNAVFGVNDVLSREILAVRAQAAQATEGAIAHTYDLVGATARTLEGEMLAHDAIIAASAAAATAAVAIELEQYLDQCGRNLCNGLGGISHLLPDLLALFETGTLLALVAEAIREPETAARAAEAVAGPIIDELDGALRALAGVG